MDTLKVFLILIVGIFSLHGQGQEMQKVEVSGRILSKQTNLPLAGATIIFLEAFGVKRQMTTISSTNGEFRMVIEKGNYDIAISFVSFQTLLLQRQKIDRDLNLTGLLLHPQTKYLEVAEVTGTQQGLSLQLDKKVFFVGSDLSAKGGTANDVLNNVPSVNVDSKGSVSLRGESGVRILINGKPSVLSANNGLEQLPASAIEKIEVINNPSAKYEAQGTAGIINIVLKKNRLSGLNGSTQLTVGSPTNNNGNINLSYKTAKLNLFGDVGFRFRDLTTKGELQRTSLDGQTQRLMKQVSRTEWGGKGYNFYIGGDYYLDSLNTLTGSFYHSTLRVDNNIENRYDFFGSAAKLDSTIYRFERYKEPKNYNQLEVSYVRTFEKRDKNWTTSLRYNFWHDDENQDIQQSTVFHQNAAENLVTQNIESSNDIFIQSDYVNTLGTNGKIEIGTRTDLRAIKSDYWATADAVLLKEYDNKLNYNERIIAGYFQWSNKVNKWSYQFGLRTELSLIEIADRKGDFKRDKRYINIFPTVHLGYKLHQNTDLQLGYSRRIDRPEFPQLNPFGGLSDLRNLVVGNPDLNPAYTDAIELTLLQNLTKFTFAPSVYYKRTNSFLQYITKETEPDFFLRTPINMDYEDRYGFELNSSYNPFSNWRLAINFNYYGFNQQGEFNGVGYFAKGNRWTAQFNSRLRLPASLVVESIFSYRSRFRDVQSINSSIYRLNVGVSKDIFKEKMSVSMAFNNIFDSLVEKQMLNGSTYKLESTNYGVGRIINITATYRFNRKKDQKDRLPSEN